jgi:hypothetical protein
MEGDSQLSLHTLTLDNLSELLIYYIYTENLYQFVTHGVDFHGYYNPNCVFLSGAFSGQNESR